MKGMREQADFILVFIGKERPFMTRSLVKKCTHKNTFGS